MSHARTLMTGVLTITALVLICVPLPAADPQPSAWTPPEASADVAEPEWGTAATNVLTLHALGFVPDVYWLHYSWAANLSGTSRILDGGAGGCFNHSLALQSGVLVTAAAIDACDNDPISDSDIHLFIVRDPRGPSPTASVVLHGHTTDAPGCQSYLYPASPAFSIGNEDNEFVIKVCFAPPQINDLIGFKAVRIYYQLQVSPAPASATFADVPTDYWAFRYVEALAASGITAGCGGDNFCPDAPLSRAQMAVFLAKALGLHWEQ